VSEKNLCGCHNAANECSMAPNCRVIARIKASNRTPASNVAESNDQNKKDFEAIYGKRPEYEGISSIKWDSELDVWKKARASVALPLGDAGKLVEALDGIEKDLKDRLITYKDRDGIGIALDIVRYHRDLAGTSKGDGNE
jgi:hypothetical protein